MKVDIDGYLKALEGRLFAAKEATEAGLRAAAEKTVDAIHSHMGGRPGPYTISGNLYESILIDDLTSSGDSYSVTISSDLAYSRRIEMGFYGSDSLGRRYAQPEYPYFWPGFEDMAEGGFLEEMRYHWTEALEGR
jgi:hypothetical protein